MLNINLLPWRETLRAQKKQRRLYFGLGVLSVVGVVGSVMVWIASHQQGVKQMTLLKETQKNQHVSRIDQLLQKIQFIAYLHQDNRIWAMLVMPSGVIADVRVGSMAGVGEARVASISREKVVLVLPDNRLFSIMAMS